MARYRFSEFVLSPRRRVLVRDGRELPLIPRYFDLLVFLVAHRHEAVHRRDIFDRVWSDVVVSDSALSQAIRTIRRTLGDDSREPRFIRTVSRHGYQFVWAEVTEEDDDHGLAGAPRRGASRRLPAPAARLKPPSRPTRSSRCCSASPACPPARRTKRINARRRNCCTRSARPKPSRAWPSRPGHARARALLRDARWDIAGAGDVPILGAPASAEAAWQLVALRLRRAARIAASRWAGAVARRRRRRRARRGRRRRDARGARPRAPRRRR